MDDENEKPTWRTVEVFTTRTSDRYQVPAVRVSEATTVRGTQRSFSVGVVVADGKGDADSFIPKPHVQERYIEETIRLLQKARETYPREVISTAAPVVEHTKRRMT